MFRPCIDLHDGRVKQIVGSTLKDGGENNQDKNSLITNFVSEKPPAEFARLYKRDNLRGGHVIMLGNGNELSAKEALAAYPGGLQVGGGITPTNAREYIEAGASHVIVTSYVFKDGTINWDNLKEMLSVIPKKNLVLDLSCRKKGDKYYVVTDRWQKFTEFEVNEENLKTLSNYCDEFLVHGVDVEGMRMGIIEDLVQLLGKYSPITITYAGGARSIEDLDLVRKLGNSRVNITVGSALDIFGGDLSYEKVVEWNKSYTVI
eukprot:TRINITY_DN2097_c0_g1_i3.p1 TRINITY_DN2097_c0_g1~~TRINITY_DN2097_c0_g1_i3.p1  ORF type:complete len:261 (-),score=40.62 TRINITY_DN2097_c0_g1_i3:1522-2304(-)